MGNYGGKTFNWPQRGARVKRRMDLPLEDWKDGATAPTESSSGTSPAVRGLLFSSTSASITIQFMIPIDYLGGPMELHVLCINTAIEGNNDDIDWTMDYITLTPQSKATDAAAFSGNTTARPNTQITSETEVFGGLAPGAGQLWDCKLTMEELNNANPLRYYGRKSPTFFAGELYRGSHGGAGNVADTLVVATYIEYMGKSDARIE